MLGLQGRWDGGREGAEEDVQGESLFTYFGRTFQHAVGFPGGSVVKNPPANAGDTGDVGSIPGSGRSPGAGNGSPLQCSFLENPVNRGA